MTETFDSFSQNGEDVVLFRGLGHIRRGHYIDVGANDPYQDSISMAFYQRGWSGITVEPDPEFAKRQREERPRDILIEAAATAKDHDKITFHVVEGTGLSTLDESTADLHAHAGHALHHESVETRRISSVLEEAGWAGQDIHFMTIDTEGSEGEVLAGMDLSVWRPWVLVIEATEPNSTESTRSMWEDVVLSAGYRFCLFDGLSCFYAAAEHYDDLHKNLRYPACVLDNFTTYALRAAREDLRRSHEREAKFAPLIDELVSWRTQAITRWSTAVGQDAEIGLLRKQIAELRDQAHGFWVQNVEFRGEVEGLRAAIADLRSSTSWKVTGPLRALSSPLVKLRRRR